MLNKTAHMLQDPQPLFFVTVSCLSGEVGGGVQAKARHTQLKPEQNDVLNLFKYRRRGQVQIRLMAVKHMPVVLSRLVVPAPDALFHAGKHWGRVVIVVVRPEVVITIGGCRVSAGLLEPRMRV